MWMTTRVVHSHGDEGTQGVWQRTAMLALVGNLGTCRSVVMPRSGSNERAAQRRMTPEERILQNDAMTRLRFEAAKAHERAKRG